MHDILIGTNANDLEWVWRSFLLLRMTKCITQFLRICRASCWHNSSWSCNVVATPWTTTDNDSYKFCRLTITAGQFIRNMEANKGELFDWKRCDCTLWLFAPCLECTQIAKVFASVMELGWRNTMVTSDFRPEVERWPFYACAMKICNILHYVHLMSFFHGQPG